jgi:hypothetical protein
LPPSSRAGGAQPFDTWLVSSPGFPTTSGFVQVRTRRLSPTAAFTVEAWMAIQRHGRGTPLDRRQNYAETWWMGQCTVGGQPTLRSYLKDSSTNGGIIPRGVWTHVAVVFNGTQRLHYINGELAATFAETGPLTTSTSDMRIGSDVSWQFTPAGAIDEVRLWNVPRTQTQIRSDMDNEIAAAQAGLIGVWALDGNSSDHRTATARSGAGVGS